VVAERATFAAYPLVFIPIRWSVGLAHLRNIAEIRVVAGRGLEGLNFAGIGNRFFLSDHRASVGVRNIDPGGQGNNFSRRVASTSICPTTTPPIPSSRAISLIGGRIL
jgi:hypothetical protein